MDAGIAGIFLYDTVVIAVIFLSLWNRSGLHG